MVRMERILLRQVSLLLTAVLAVTGAGCAGSGSGTTGASAPPKIQVPDAAGTHSTPPATGNRTDPIPPGVVSPGAAPSPPGGPDPARTPLATVTAYFDEINKASMTGRVADVSATAMPGCQPCLLDIGVTQNFHNQGGHADVGPLTISPVSMGPVGEKVATARLTVAIRAVRLLDAAGNVITVFPAQPPHAVTVTLRLTVAGWRIENFLYSRRPS
jgi:hypothetical protein